MKARLGRVLVCVAILAGCASPPGAPAASVNAPTLPGTDADASADLPLLPVGERGPVEPDHYAFAADHSLAWHDPLAPEIPLAKVAEVHGPAAFASALVQDPTFPPWTAEPDLSAFETTGTISILLRWSADAPAASTIPKPSGIAPVGAWLGAPDRWTLFVMATSAPDTLEANKVYEARLSVDGPKGGLFLRPGEPLVVTPWLFYQTADGRPVSYVVGGPDPAGVKFDHQHFMIALPNATVLVASAGETGPNPTLTGDDHPQPVDLALVIPPEAVYVVIEADGQGKAGEKYDLDLRLRDAAGTVLMGSYGPGVKERIVLGPGNLAAMGRDLVLRVVSAGASGGTFTVTATAYSA